MRPWLVASALLLLAPALAGAAAPPAWVYHVAAPPPGGADPVLHGAGGVDRREACPIEVPGCYMESFAVPDLDVAIHFERVATQPACNSPAYAAAFRLTFQSRQLIPDGPAMLQGQADLAWGGQRLLDPTASGGGGFTPVSAPGYVGFSYAGTSHSSLDSGATVTVDLRSDGSHDASATGTVATHTLTLDIRFTHPARDGTEEFHWTGSGPAAIFAQLVEPPGACLPL